MKSETLCQKCRDAINNANIGQAGFIKICKNCSVVMAINYLSIKMKGNMIEFEMYEDLNQGVIDNLWNQSVDMDDWDYLLFVKDEYKDHFQKTDKSLRGNFEPKSWQVEKLLQGCCSNAWYEVQDFMGKKGFVGIAYHA